MPAVFKSHIDKGHVDGAYAYSNFLNARNQLYYAGDYIASEEWALAKTALYNAADLFGTAASYLLQDGLWGHGLRAHWFDALDWLNNNWPTDGPAEITMDAILDAMWNSIGGQTMTFITYIDAMRGSISEKTVFEPYLSSYLRHFLEQ